MNGKKLRWWVRNKASEIFNDSDVGGLVGIEEEASLEAATKSEQLRKGFFEQVHDYNLIMKILFKLNYLHLQKSQMSVTCEPAKLGSRATYSGAGQSSMYAKQAKLHKAVKSSASIMLFQPHAETPPLNTPEIEIKPTSTVRSPLLFIIHPLNKPEPNGNERQSSLPDNSLKSPQPAAVQTEQVH